MLSKRLHEIKFPIFTIRKYNSIEKSHNLVRILTHHDEYVLDSMLLKEKEPDAVILVQSALDSSDTIISIMKLGVFDYIIKPIDPELFEKSIRKALEYKDLKDTERNLADNAALKIRNQLDWLIRAIIAHEF